MQFVVMMQKYLTSLNLIIFCNVLQKKIGWAENDNKKEMGFHWVPKSLTQPRESAALMQTQRKTLFATAGPV